MQKDMLIMLAGVFVGILPFLGFPNSWDSVFLVAAGVCIIGLGIAVRRGNRSAVHMFSAHEDQTHEEA